MQTEVERFMGLALGLAQRAHGATFPNPLVGAVIVKNGKIVGRGFHKKAGGAHAEIFALREAGPKARGAALFCTFEPCAHSGRTGPCVDEIIRAGIREVYVGLIDPNPLNKGKGVRKLKNAGIRVKTGFLEERIRRLNEPFIKAMTKMMPFVTIKIAQSLDGKIATRTGVSQWITNEMSRKYSHGLRRYFDAIMVGINTVIKDDPRLECPYGPKGHRLTKIILDSGLKVPLSARLLATKQPVIIATLKKDKLKEEALAKRGVVVIHARPQDGRVGLKDLLKRLNRLEIRSILVEGGSELIGSLIDEKLADKVLVFIAPKVIGGRQALSSVGGKGAADLACAPRLEDISFKKFKNDILIEGYLEYGR